MAYCHIGITWLCKHFATYIWLQKFKPCHNPFTFIFVQFLKKTHGTRQANKNNGDKMFEDLAQY
jgi:hypothetical protein